MKMDDNAEKTKQIEGTETFVSPPTNPYSVNPYAPPPPKKTARVMNVLLVVIGLLLIGSVIFVGIHGILLRQQHQPAQTQGASFASSSVLPTPTATPFPDNLSSIDNSVFIPAWSNALATHNMSEIAAYTDQQQFHLLCVEADTGCDNNWAEMQGAMEGTNLQLRIPEPYSLVSPTPGLCPDVVGLGPHINSNDIQYVSATFTNNYQVDCIPEYLSNGPAIFEFAYSAKTPSQTPYNIAGAMLLEAVYLNEQCQ